MKVTYRGLVSHYGHHRRRTRKIPGVIVDQRFVRCSQCGGVESAATVHGDMLRCAEGHLVPGEAS